MCRLVDDWTVVEEAAGKGLAPPVFISISRIHGHDRIEVDIKKFQPVNDFMPFSLGRLWQQISKS